MPFERDFYIRASEHLMPGENMGKEIETKTANAQQTARSVDVSIVIPAYNEAGSIGKVLEEISKEILSASLRCEILVVNDGSSDRTAEIASRHDVRLISHPYNKGYGASLKTGAREARGEYVLYIDGDGQHYADDIAKFLPYIGKYDMVVGARPKQASALRGFYKIFMHSFAGYLAERKIPDLNSGFRMIRRSLVIKYLHLLPDSFSFTTTITLALLKEGLNVEFIPIRIRNRKEGRSSIRPFRDGFRFIMLMLRMTMLFSPLRVFMPASFGLFLMGLPLLIYNIFYVEGVVGLLLILTSTLVFFFGLIADQISILLRSPR